MTVLPRLDGSDAHKEETIKVRTLIKEMWIYLAQLFGHVVLHQSAKRCPQKQTGTL